MSISNPNYSNLDSAEMAKAIGLKEKFIPMLIGSFLEESNPILEKLENAISTKDFQQIRSLAHSIKGSAGNLKFNEIYEMSREIELSATDTNEDFDYSAYLEAIKVAISTIPN